ncbi:hypothetical protein QOZ80_2AG0099710 [Eleusine coracana subsp. coracana]|nr:hypothetical protein QOZ80_2AG0099710 [Eleusine coracana subsp. coracana]
MGSADRALSSAGNIWRGCRAGSIRSSLVSEPLLASDFDLQEGLTDVQKILHQRRKNSQEMMAAVDNLKRLCIDHYFQEEIEDVMGSCMNLIHSHDLHDATLALRLLREDGHDVSADEILRKFTNCSGEFIVALSDDIRGLLSLHDMSHLNMGGEASLYKAKEFSSKHLASVVRHLEPSLARHHLRYLQSLPNRNTAMEELAIAEFHLNKLLHQEEMQETKRWWMDLGLAQTIPVARDQVLKWYMWPMTVLQGSSLSRYRVEMTKIISLVYIVDDIFDLVGTTEELSCFTHAVEMWDSATTDSLPSYMRSCYKALYNVTNGIADMAEKEHGLNPIDHLRKAWVTLFHGFMVEAKWLATDHVPSAEDYLRNGVVTSGAPLAFAHAFFLLGHDGATCNDAAKLIKHIPPVISCPAKILRLWDDMGSAKDEAQEGLDGSYKDFYLMENPSYACSDAKEHMHRLIEREWEELNRECFRRKRTFSSIFMQACLNAARMVSVMYGYNKEQRLPVLEDYMKMLLL